MAYTLTFDEDKNFLKVLFQYGKPAIGDELIEFQDIISTITRRVIYENFGNGAVVGYSGIYPGDGLKVTNLEGTTELYDQVKILEADRINNGPYYYEGYRVLSDDYYLAVVAGSWKVYCKFYEEEIDAVEDPDIKNVIYNLETTRRFRLKTEFYAAAAVPSDDEANRIYYIYLADIVVGTDGSVSVTDKREFARNDAAIQTELTNARNSSVYGAKASVDLRIEEVDQEVEIARSSSVYGAKASLDERIEAVDVEVDTARGSQATLDARFDAEHDEAGKHTKDNVSGWHNDQDRIKLMPGDFTTDNTSYPLQVDDGGEVHDPNDVALHVATKSIPIGYKATHVMVYADNVQTVEVYECDINNVTATSKGSGNTNTEIDITDVTADSTNYLSMQVGDSTFPCQTYGGYITIARV